MIKNFLILLGAPGSGKGTQSSLLSTYFNIPIVSTGDLIRHEIKVKSTLGLKVEPLINNGDLVPDNLIIDLFSQSISKPEFTNGFISDGFPRTFSQAKMLDDLLSSIDHVNVYVFLLDINVDYLLERLLGRLVCPKCNAIYHSSHSPPHPDNTCLVCNTPVISRNDDNKDTIVNRNNVFINQISPVLTYYSDRVINIDANKSSNDVFSIIKSYLNINT